MKTTQILKTGLIAFTALGLTLTSCKKDKDESTNSASSCHEFVSGVLEVTPTGKLTRVIDFGAGSCDETVTVTVGKHTETFTSKK